MEDKDKKSIDDIPGGGYLVINNQVVPIEMKRTNIGRHLENDIVINETTVSRKHACIYYEDRSFIVSDLDSTGGTFVNNEKVQNCALQSGDVIKLATTSIMFIQSNLGLKHQSRLVTSSLRE